MNINLFVSKMVAATSAEAPKGGSTGSTPAPKLMGDPGVPGTPAYELSHLSDGRSAGEVVNDLAKDDLKVAYEAINECYDIQWQKDGIDDLKNRLKTLEGRVNEKVFAIAKAAMKHCEDKMIIAKPYFVALCDQAETMKLNWYVQKHKEETTMAKMIPSWSTYKSQIATGLEFGINPLEKIPDSKQADGTEAPKYATANQYITAVVAKQKADKATGSQAGNDRNSQTETGTQLQLVTKGWSVALRAAMDAMCKALNTLSHEDQDMFADDILEIAADITLFKASRPAKGAMSADPSPDSEYAKQHPEEFKDGKYIGRQAAAAKADSEVASEELDPGTKAAMQTAIDAERVKQVAKVGVHQGPTDNAGKNGGGSKSGKKGPKAA